MKRLLLLGFMVLGVSGCKEVSNNEINDVQAVNLLRVYELKTDENLCVFSKEFNKCSLKVGQITLLPSGDYFVSITIERQYENTYDTATVSLFTQHRIGDHVTVTLPEFEPKYAGEAYLVFTKQGNYAQIAFDNESPIGRIDSKDIVIKLDVSERSQQPLL